MAEARLAVAFQVQVTDEGEFKVHLDRRILHDVYRSIKRVIKRKIFKSRNAAIQVISCFQSSDWLAAVTKSSDWLAAVTKDKRKLRHRDKPNYAKSRRKMMYLQS